MKDQTIAEVDRLLHNVRQGETAAMNQVWEMMQPELKIVARALLRNERHTTWFGATGTGLVSELWIRLVPTIDSITSARSLLNVGRTAMKRILIDYARYRGSARRAHERVAIEDALREVGISGDKMLENLMEAIEDMRKSYPDHAEAVDLYYIDGFTQDEGAQLMRVSRSDFQRMLAMAIGILKDALSNDRAA